LDRAAGIAALLLVSAAGSLAAQRGWDVQGHALVLGRDSTLVGGGVGGGLRIQGGLRVAVTASAGWLAPDTWAGRGEVVAAYHLPSVRPRSPGLYIGGGVAGEAWSGDVRGMILALIGIEQRPRAGGGWFGEIGVGGGVRFAVGYRVIRLARRR